MKLEVIPLDERAFSLRVTDEPDGKPGSMFGVQIQTSAREPKELHQMANRLRMLAAWIDDAPERREAAWPADDNWPRDQYGRLICSPSRPMPSNRPSMGNTWVHLAARIDHDVSDEFRAYFWCETCRARWTVDLRKEEPRDESDQRR